MKFNKVCQFLSLFFNHFDQNTLVTFHIYKTKKCKKNLKPFGILIEIYLVEKILRNYKLAHIHHNEYAAK